MNEPTGAIRILLVGMMGCGKTTVGRALSARTGWPYVDNDAMVAELSGQATPDLAALHGGDALHVTEAVVVDRILAMEPPLVAGIPGSAIAAEALRDHLRAAGHVVWLRARLETLVARIGDGSTRPFFAGQDVAGTLARLYEGREPLYASSAHQVVDVDDLEPDVIVDRILAGLARG